MIRECISVALEQDAEASLALFKRYDQHLARAFAAGLMPHCDLRHLAKLFSALQQHCGELISSSEDVIPSTAQVLYETPISRFKQMFAQQDHAEAQLRLATLYLNGLGARKINWMQRLQDGKSGGTGGTEALYQLGLMCLDDDGVTEDAFHALELFGLAAADNHPQAQRLYDYYPVNELPADC